MPVCIVQRRRADPPWTEPLRRLIQQHTTFGYRYLWALLREQEGIVVNRKSVYRVLKQKQSGWSISGHVRLGLASVAG